MIVTGKACVFAVHLVARQSPQDAKSQGIGQDGFPAILSPSGRKEDYCILLFGVSSPPPGSVTDQRRQAGRIRVAFVKPASGPWSAVACLACSRPGRAKRASPPATSREASKRDSLALSEYYDTT
jgi:hypothetical protein